MVCINGVYVYKWCVRLWTSSELHSPAACRHSQRSHETEPPDRSVHRDVYLIAIRAIVQIAPISCDHPALVGRAFRVSVRLGNTVHRRISRILRSIQGFWDPLEAVESFRMLTNANECYPSLSRTISLSKCRKLFGIIPMDFGDSLSQYRFPSEASKLPAPKSASFSKSGEPKINVNTVQWNTWQSVKHKEAIERAYWTSYWTLLNAQRSQWHWVSDLESIRGVDDVGVCRGIFFLVFFYRLHTLPTADSITGSTTDSIRL